MYSFEPTEEQKMLVEAARRFAENELRAAAHEADEQEALPGNLIQKGWQLGLLQASIPEEYGGFGDRSAVSGVLAAEELAYGDLAAALAIMLPATFAMPILIAGDEEQKGSWLPKVAEGDWQPYSAAFIEPAFDFFPGELHTKAMAQNGGYRISGRKTFVPFADQAPAFIVYADLEGTPAAFVVEAEAAGLSVGERQGVLGLGAVPLFELTLEEVEVEQKALLRGTDDASGQMIAATRTAIAAMAVGLSRASYEYSLAYAKERVAFDEPIAQKQSIAFMLAEMVTEIEAIRLMVWEAAWKIDAGEPAEEAAYLALMGASDMAMMVTDRGVQILGGHGYIREHPVERWMRNGRGIPTFAGLAMV
ncbi:MAG: acyl-CoA dehydrogenase family protein [Anaerolineales bacterium]